MTQSQLAKASPVPAAIMSGNFLGCAPVALLLLDRHGRVQGQNQEFDTLFGKSGKDDCSVDSFFPAELHPSDLVGLASRGESPLIRRFWHERLGLFMELRLESLGENWLLSVTPCAASPASRTSELSLLDDLRASRASIASYLHETICQNLIGVSFLLAKAEREPAGGPALAKARAVVDTGAHEVRALMRVLAPRNPYTGDEPFSSSGGRAEDDLADHISDLREYAGLRVVLAKPPADFPDIPPVSFALFSAALQKWAEGALSQPCARRAETFIALSSSARGIAIEFRSDVAGDTAIGGLLASGTLRACLEGLRGELRVIPGHSGSSAVLFAVRVPGPHTAESDLA